MIKSSGLILAVSLLGLGTATFAENVSSTADQACYRCVKTTFRTFNRQGVLREVTTCSYKRALEMQHAEFYHCSKLPAKTKSSS